MNIYFLFVLLPLMVVSGVVDSATEHDKKEHQMHTQHKKNHHSPYANEHRSPVTSLRSDEYQGLLNGKGMGFARPAELNEFPGPLHVLDLAKQLALSEKQTGQVKAIFDKMKRHSIEVGKEVISKESELNELFKTKQATRKNVEQLTHSIALLRGKLRSVHLLSHFDVRELLTKEQINIYTVARGYTGAKNNNNHHH